MTDDIMILPQPAPFAIPASYGAAGNNAAGTPGGNVMAVGLFTALALSLTAVPAGTDLIKTSGHTTAGKGSAEYVYDAAVDAAYVSANPNTSFRDPAGRGFRLIPYQTLNWHMFGLAVNDNAGTGTDDRAAMVAMFAWQKAQRQIGSGISQYGNGGFNPIWCFGAAYMSAGITVDYAAACRGFSKGVTGASPTQLRYPANTYGVLFDTGSAGHEFEGFTMRGGWDAASTGTDGDEGEYHAIEWHAPGVKRNLQFYNWQGAALKDDNDAASSGGAHNSNEDVIEICFSQYCRNLYEPSGGDVNAKTVDHLSSISNRQATVLCKSFLGIKYGLMAGESNGFVPWVNVGTTAARPASLTWFNSRVWTVIGGQETGARTNAPPSSATFNTWWVQSSGWGNSVVEATAHSFGVPTWASGGYYRPGNATFIHQGDSNRSTVEFLYSEDNQINQVDLNCGAMKGNANFFAVVNASSGTFFPGAKAPFTKGTLHDYNMTVGGTLIVRQGMVTLGPTVVDPVLGAQDSLVQFYSSNALNTLWFRSLGLGSDNLDGSITSTFNLLQVSGKTTLRFQLNGVTKVSLTAGQLAPADDNAQTLGAAGNRWSTVYAGTGTINTSDERLKTDIAPIGNALLDAWGEVEWCQYRFNDAIAAKADGARLHFGLIAQRVKAVFEKHGLDAFAHGVLCYDEWDDAFEGEAPEEVEYLHREVSVVPGEFNEKTRKWGKPTTKVVDSRRKTLKQVVDQDGKPVMKLVRAAGNGFGVRYQEASAIEHAWMRRELARLRKAG